MQLLFDRTMATTEVFTENNRSNCSVPGEIFKSFSALEPDGTPFSTGAISVDKGKNRNLLKPGHGDFLLQSVQRLLDSGKPLLKIYSFLRKIFFGKSGLLVIFLFTVAVRTADR